MNEIDNFLEFLYENRNHEKINISRGIKYGSKHYYIYMSLEVDNAKSDFDHFSDFSLIIDSANSFISIQTNDGDASFEDAVIVNKWSNILDEYLNENSINKLEEIIVKSLSSSKSKDLLRAFKLKKIV